MKYFLVLAIVAVVATIAFYINFTNRGLKMGGIEALGINEKDLNKMIKLMMCSEVSVDGKKCHRFYFSSWYFNPRTKHPVGTERSITWTEARRKGRKAYYEAMLCPDASDKHRFVSFTGFLNIINPFELRADEKKRLLDKSPGDYYFMAEKEQKDGKDDKVLLGQEITVYDTMALEKYIHVAIGAADLKSIESDVMSKTIKRIYEYFYDAQGVMTRAAEKVYQFERVHDDNDYLLKTIDVGHPDINRVYEYR